MGNASNRPAEVQQPQIDETTQQTLMLLQATLKGKNKLTDICFDQCVHDFTTRKVIQEEERCIKNCVDKWLRYTTRVSETFAGVYMQQNPLPPTS